MILFLLAFLTVIVLAVLYKLFQYLFLNKAAYASHKSFAALKIEYAAHYFKSQGAFLLFASVATFLLYKLLPWLLDYKLSFISDSIFVIKSGKDMCLATSLFSGLFVATIATFMLAKRQLQENYPEYLAYFSRRYRFDAVMITKYTMGIYAVGVTALIIVFFGHYTIFGQKDIKIGKPFYVGTKTYKYSNVVSIKEVERLHAPNGNIVNDPHYIIRFSDGGKWSSRDDGFETHELNTDVINLIKANTHLQPVKVEFDE